MFGYVMIRKPELKIKDYEIYHGFYCGLCQCLKERYGFMGQMTLTYDMTFLIILLTSLYEDEVTTKKLHSRCKAHPVKKQKMLINEITEYAADMNIILSYYHFQDDWADEENVKALAMKKILQKSFYKVYQKYPQKCRKIKHALQKLSEYEKEKVEEIVKPAECFGNLMAVLMEYRKDVFSKELRQLGYYLGKFIYYMDAFEDVEKDCESGSYNPFKKYRKDKNFVAKMEQLLLDCMARASAVFEKLPCVQNQDILKNILYAGVWNKFDKIALEKTNQKEEKRKIKEEEK